jgi:nicotinate phosphoribosyltransferase
VSTTASSTALFTDRYELTMLQGALRSGAADRRAVFEVFARRLPAGRRYGVVAGLGRLLDLLERFRFDAQELVHLATFLDDRTLEHLASYRFAGDIDAYREGELYFPSSPVLTIEASFGDAIVLETLVLSVLNHDSAVASAASRMRVAAGRRHLVEMGGRRTHEHAAVAAARAAFIAGFDSTSNLEAGRSYGIPTVGTSAHAFTLAHNDEREAFAAQVATAGAGTTLVVDTFDVDEAIRTAVSVAGPELGAIRLDSGDLSAEAHRARTLLDELGAGRTRIVASGELDEFAIERLAAAPIDAYGVGTALVMGSGAPTAEFIYKLVARDGEPVAKRSPNKATAGGRKWAFRMLGPDGMAYEERIVTTASEGGRPLQVPVVRDGEVLHRPSLDEMRAHHIAARAELPVEGVLLEPGGPALGGSSR